MSTTFFEIRKYFSRSRKSYTGRFFKRGWGNEGIVDHGAGRRELCVGGAAVAGAQPCVHVFSGGTVFLAHWAAGSAETNTTGGTGLLGRRCGDGAGIPDRSCGEPLAGVGCVGLFRAAHEFAGSGVPVLFRAVDSSGCRGGGAGGRGKAAAVRYSYAEIPAL